MLHFLRTCSCSYVGFVIRIFPSLVSQSNISLRTRCGLNCKTESECSWKIGCGFVHWCSQLKQCNNGSKNVFSLVLLNMKEKKIYDLANSNLKFRNNKALIAMYNMEVR